MPVKLLHKYFVCLLIAQASLMHSSGFSMIGENNMDTSKKVNLLKWQKTAVERARIMSRVRWTPIADGIPVKGRGYFKKGVEYTGVPYSSVKSVGRYIGFDIYLKTFLAAVQNPCSVVYTENLSKKVTNSGPYYGKVCSSYTSYALGCGSWYASFHHAPLYRKGISLLEAQSAQAARVGDIILTPRSKGSHVEIITDITMNVTNKITHVRVEDSWPQTTRNINYEEKAFNEHLKGKKIYRISDLDAWRGKNKSESFLFPNYEDDSATPVINRVFLLDRGDWVSYKRGQIVKINVMDKDKQGVKKLVIKRSDKIIEEIANPKGVIDRSFPVSGNYTAHCVMNDDTLSQSCEFSVCDFDFILPAGKHTLGKPLEIKFTSDNMKVVIIYIMSSNPLASCNVFVTETNRQKGKIVIPGDLLQDEGNLQFWMICENKYGRLKKRQDVFVEKILPDDDKN